MIKEVFSSGIETGSTKRVATSIVIVSFSPDVLHLHPIHEPTLATGALSSCVKHSSCTAHKLNYLKIRTTFDV